MSLDHSHNGFCFWAHRQFVKGFSLISLYYVEARSTPQRTKCRGQPCCKVSCKWPSKWASHSIISACLSEMKLPSCLHKEANPHCQDVLALLWWPFSFPVFTSQSPVPSPHAGSVICLGSVQRDPSSSKLNSFIFVLTGGYVDTPTPTLACGLAFPTPGQGQGPPPCGCRALQVLTPWPCHWAVGSVKVNMELCWLRHILMPLWMATHGWAHLLLKVMSDEGLSVVLPFKVSCPRSSRGPAELLEGMFSLSNVSGLVCLFEAFLRCCVEHTGLDHTSGKDSQEITFWGGGSGSQWFGHEAGAPIHRLLTLLLGWWRTCPSKSQHISILPGKQR